MSATKQCEKCGESIGADWPDALCGFCSGRVTIPEASELLPDVEDFARRYLVLSGEDEWTAFALWVAHSHAIDGAHATPYLLLTSPGKRSGKTRTQEVLELLVAKPWRAAGASEAAIFRRIAADRPTLLLDEIDAVFGTYTERTEPLRAILNAGNRPGATVARCVGDGGEEVRDFSVYCAKCLAGIDTGRLPDTIQDRSIPIGMRRKTSAEPVERLRWRVANAQVEPLRDRLARWGAVSSDQLREADPDTPPQLDDRAAEAWEPLLAIADLAGGEWPQRARRAAVALSAAGEQELTRGELLLDAIRTVFGSSDRMRTEDLLEVINQDEELPFGGYRDGKGLDSRLLARMLKPYQIRSRTIRIDGATPKGYLREQFTDAWKRWVPPTPPTEAQQAQHPQHAPPAATQKPHGKADVADVAAVAAVSGVGADVADLVADVADGSGRNGEGPEQPAHARED